MANIPRTSIAKSVNIDSYDAANSISGTFCSAKWNMVTMHLAQGENHSCYHPQTHKIPLDELKEDSGALHNTKHKKNQRTIMLKNERPSECAYCWKIEDLGHISDRIIRNNENWSDHGFSEYQNITGEENVFPRQVEVSFSTTCNLKCSYCNPNVSSKWLEEVQKYGGYPTSTKFNNFALTKDTIQTIRPSEENPYIDAFWDYLPKMYDHLTVLRVTGGEPLLSKDTFKLLDYIKQNENKNLEVAVNSNFCVPDEQISKLIRSATDILSSDMVKSFKMFLSVDATEHRAEYGRYGFNWDQFTANIERYLTEVPSGRVSFTVTFNVFSVTDTLNLVKYIHQLRNKFTKDTKVVTFDIPYLTYPPHQCINILPDTFLSYLKETEEYMTANTESLTGFSQLEIEKIKRIQAFMQAKDGVDVDTYRKDFAIFVDEHDRRRGTNFLATFPEYEQFYQLCKTL